MSKRRKAENHGDTWWRNEEEKEAIRQKKEAYMLSYAYMHTYTSKEGGIVLVLVLVDVGVEYNNICRHNKQIFVNELVLNIQVV